MKTLQIPPLSDEEIDILFESAEAEGPEDVISEEQEKPARRECMPKGKYYRRHYFGFGYYVGRVENAHRVMGSLE
jgi:hypothetical protein